MGPVDILLITFKHLEDIQAVVRLIYRNTVSPFRLLVADNGREPEILDWLHDLAREKGNVVIVENPENRFCCLASNQLFDLVRTRYAFYMCSYEAFALRRGWDLECIEAMDVNPRAGVGGYLSWSKYYLTGHDYKHHEFFAKFRNPGWIDRHLDRKFFHIQGGFFIIRMEMVHAIGGFNEALAHGHMDVEYSYYIESCDWGLLELPNVLSIHRTTQPGLDHYDLREYSVVHPLSAALCAERLPEMAEAIGSR